jgi:hypothetical protein
VAVPEHHDADYVSNWGPLDGPILGRHMPPALFVYDSATVAAMPIGIAYPIGLTDGEEEPISTFRLVVGKEELPGEWMCDRRRFVRIGAADAGTETAET